MRHLLYEVPVRVAGGLLFELLGQSVGDPYINEDDVPVVLRSWQSQNFLITALHLKGSAEKINVLGITEVQELLLGGGFNAPRTAHEVIVSSFCLARWDDRPNVYTCHSIISKSIFGAADEVELKFMNRRTHEDLYLFGIILNQEIRRLSQQVIRVKWSLHAREEIVFELLQHLRGTVTRTLLEGIRKSTRQMIEEQEAVRGRLFTIQDVMQSTVRAWLYGLLSVLESQKRHIQMALAGMAKPLKVKQLVPTFEALFLNYVWLFGINEMESLSENTPYASSRFVHWPAILSRPGLLAVGLIYLGLKNPISEQKVEIRKLELQELVKMFEHEAETQRPSLSTNIKK
ncbi:hypothetical protein Leryth_000469 [Lithospermum erythrorhizon]|nr:hypothetical protein Leryth_000469 [Lithospermum erythrorhizon]